MSILAYTQYRDSSLPVADSVPDHWTSTKIKYICEFSTGWTPPTGDDASYLGDNLWVNISDLGPKVISDTAKRISDEAIAKSEIAATMPGDLMFSFKLSIGQVSFAGACMYTNEAIATFHASKYLRLDFAYYAFPIYVSANASENIYGAKLLNQSLIRSATIELPPVGEQATIAAFLDRETFKIDALIAEQERLIALLAEKRQAVISHAVTKGLDPTAPMKDSGVEWLGEVPAHWQICSLGHVSVEQCDGPFGSGLKSDHYVETGVRVVRLQNIRNCTFDATDAAYINESYYLEELNGKHDVRTNDILIAGLGDDRNTVGRACVAPKGIEPAMVKADCFRFRLSEAKVLPDFVAAQLTVSSPHDAGVLATGSTRSRIPLSLMAYRRLALPPLEEQAAIMDHILASTTRLSNLMSDATDAIALLTERRSALIAAAVTGKIDVRGLADAVEAA